MYPTQGPGGLYPSRVDPPSPGSPPALKPLRQGHWVTVLWLAAPPPPAPHAHHMLIFLHTVPATLGSSQLDRLAMCPAPGTLHQPSHLEHSSLPLPSGAPVHQISASQGSVGRPLVKPPRDGFQSPTVTCPAPASPAGQKWPQDLTRAQADCWLSKASQLSPFPADLSLMSCLYPLSSQLRTVPTTGSR